MSIENKKISSIYWQHVVCFACWFLLFSCNTTKYLQEEEAFLEKNLVEFESTQKIKKKRKLESDLLSITKQKPNTNFFLINRRWFYYHSKKKKKKNARRLIAEIPSIYSEILSKETAESMRLLLYQKGYYNAIVDFKTEIERQQATVTYLVNTGDLYTVDTINYISKDSNIQKILIDISSESLLKKGEAVSNQSFEADKKRIRDHLRNVGYRDFYSNYFDQLESTTDSSKSKNLNLSLKVFPLNDTTNHKIYKIGNIDVYPFYNPQNTLSYQRDTIIDNIRFMRPNNTTYQIRPDVIARRIFLKKGALYSQNNFNKTSRNLGELGIFKFANINERISTDSINLINFSIYLPANRRRSIGGNIEYKNTSFSQSPTTTGDNLNGIETSFSYQDKNAFGGSEVFNANLGFGIQFGGTSNASSNSLINTYDISPRFDLSIPKFRDLFGLVRFMNKIGVFSNQFYESMLENANTRLSLGLNWSERRDFWGYFSTDLSLGYEVQNNPDRLYFVKQLGLNIFQPSVGIRGKEVFDNNPFLERTFNNPQLFTGLFIRDFSFSFSGRKPEKSSSWRLFFNSEVSGIEASLVNSIANQFRSEKNDTLKLGALNFAQFGRLDIDARYYKFISSKRSLAFRLNTGVAFPFGTSDDVPYVKQFFAGGPNSVRAWRIRELGPGSYQDPSTFPGYRENSSPFYQTGDFKLIFNAEYRFLFFKFYGFDWEGSIFLDGGNVWTLRADGDRPGSNISTRFLKQIALGTGAGLRVNFEYFILRLDLGYKLRNPYPNPNGSYWASQEFKELGLRGINYNLAVGYAF